MLSSFAQKEHSSQMEQAHCRNEVGNHPLLLAYYNNVPPTVSLLKICYQA